MLLKSNYSDEIVSKSSNLCVVVIQLVELLHKLWVGVGWVSKIDNSIKLFNKTIQQIQLQHLAFMNHYPETDMLFSLVPASSPNPTKHTLPYP